MIIAGLKKLLIPKSLMARMQVLVVLPILLVVGASATIFFTRHWHEVQTALVRGLVRDVALIHQADGFKNQQKLAEKLEIKRNPNAGTLPDPPMATDSVTDTLIFEELSRRFDQGFDVKTSHEGKQVSLWIVSADGVVEYQFHRNRVESFTIRLMIAVVMACVLLFISLAALFMHRQVRPILALTRAIRTLQQTSASLHEPIRLQPRGAAEVQDLARAFIEFQQEQFNRMQERSNMLRGISHDLRTPLTRIKLELEVLDPGPETEAINRDIDLMDAMLESYLDFVAHNRTGQPVILALEEIVDGLKVRWRSVSDRLEFSEIPPGCHLAVRRDLFDRALDNLLDNGLHHGERVWITVSRNGQRIDWCIEDDGPGIPESERKKVLQPFFRSARSQTHRGTGLGLALASEILRRHEGAINLEDSPHGGLRVRLTLPLSEA